MVRCTAGPWGCQAVQARRQRDGLAACGNATLSYPPRA